MSGLISNKGARPYIYGLIALWVIGCLLQYIFCCKDSIKAIATTASSATMTTIAEKPATTTPSVAAVTMPAFELSDTDKQVLLSHKSNLTFAQDNMALNPVDDDIAQTLSQLTKHVAADKALSITGYYLASEQTPQGFDNMGLARADAVKQWLIQKDYAPQQIITAAEQKTSLVGKDNQHLIATDFSVVKAIVPVVEAQVESTPEPVDVVEPVAVEPVKTPVTKTIAMASSNPFKVTAEGLDLFGNDNFNFISGDAQPTHPIAENLDNNLSQLIDYLNAAPARQLTVTGRYHPDEHNGSAFPDLGLARANQVKEYLLLSGAHSQQITLASQAYPNAVANAQKHFAGMVNFDLLTLDNSSIQARSLTMQQLAKDIHTSPLTLYFDTGVSEIVLSTEQRDHLLKITQYLDFNVDAKAVVTGHTDNVGSRETNTRLGKERADFAAEYLSKNGLRRSQMLVDSKGPDQPIADNTSEDGRAKNRRVTITISEKN